MKVRLVASRWREYRSGDVFDAGSETDRLVRAGAAVVVEEPKPRRGKADLDK